MSAEVSAAHDGDLSPEPARRDFLKLVTMATAAPGGAAVAWAFIDSMNPAADVIAAGASMDIDVSKLAPGQQIVILWRGSPIVVVNRTPDALKTLQQPSLIGRLSDPNSSVE
jgi:ubiquinol-cytochrome c reductase iron-sulfur subunit